MKILELDQYVIDVALTLAYITNVLYNPTASENLRGMIDKKLDEIEKNPYMFSIHNWKVKHDHEYRKAKVGNYYIFFYIENEVIIVARFVYSRMDLDEVVSN